MAASAIPGYIVEAFGRFDSDGSGSLEAQELPEALADCALYCDDATLREIVRVYADAQTGLALHEFASLALDMADGLHHGIAPLLKPKRAAAIVDHAPAAQQKRTGKAGVPSYVRAAFKRFDADNSGSLDTEELPLALRE